MKTRSEILRACFERIPQKTIDEPKLVNECLMAADEMGTLLSPVSAVNDVPQAHAVSFRYVFLDHTVWEYGQGTDTYKSGQFCKKENQRALSQEGILKLWKAASGRDVSVTRLDDRSDPLYAEVQVIVGLRGLDGREESYTGTRELDLRPSSPESKTMRDGQLRQAQATVARNAESKARLRAIRKALALRQVYTTQQLDLPFIIPALVAQIDTSDPATRRLVSAHALGIVDKVFQRPSEHEEHDAPQAALPETTVVRVDDDGVAVDEPVEAEVVDDLPAPPPAAPDWCCTGCPCGCSRSITKAEALNSKKIVGIERCPECFPSPKTFNLDKHKDCNDLKLPGRADITVAVMGKHMAAIK